MVIPKELILNYIPQRAPLVMVDRLLSASSDRFETDLQIMPGNFFLDNDVLVEYGLVENILQSCAAGLAVLNQSGRKGPVNGFVGAVSKLKIHHLPHVHDTLRTTITPLAQLGDWYLAKGITSVGDQNLI